MLLDCPSCSAKYSVSASAIGDKGRDVRCKKCGHVWFQKPERASLDDLINKIQSQAVPDDEISFGDDGVVAAVSASSAKIKNKPKKTPNKNGLLSRGQRLAAQYCPATRVAGVMVGAAVLSCIIWAALVGRVGIAHTIPAMEKIYENIGFPLSPYARVAPEKALVLDRLAWTKNHRGAGGILQGQVINLTSKPVRIPKIHVLFQDDKARILADEIVTLGQEGLGKEAVYPFIATISTVIPAKANTITVRFAE